MRDILGIPTSCQLPGDWKGPNSLADGKCCIALSCTDLYGKELANVIVYNFQVMQNHILQDDFKLNILVVFV